MKIRMSGKKLPEGKECHVGEVQVSSEAERRSRPPGEGIPRRYVGYALLVCAAAGGALGVVLPGTAWEPVAGEPRFWLFAALLLVGELLPTQGRRQRTHDGAAISGAFAFAILLDFGTGPALVACGVASVVNDLCTRPAALKTPFNASQKVLSIGAAALAFRLAGHPVPVSAVGHVLPAVVVGAMVALAVKHALVDTGAALMTRTSISRQLVHDLPFQVWAAGFLLALAPIVVVSAHENLAFVPIAFLPMLGIYFGGRQAAVNAHRAVHDALTDLPNRSLLRTRLGSALGQARRERLSVIVLMIDLDDFKAVNDSLGHHSGDLLLVKVAQRLSSSLRQGDTLARLGGDEFAIVAEAVTETAEADEIARRVLVSLEQPFELDSLRLDVRASIGIACYPEHGTDTDELLQHADMALYRAKDSELPYEMFGPDHDDGLDRVALATQLKRGIEHGELVLDYQPKFPLRSGGPEAVEALVRWNHPQLGVIGPEGFIQLAEHTGLIKPLTDFVLAAALGQCAKWRRAGLALRTSVNICTRSLLDQELAGSIRAHLGEHGLPPSALQLEITESRTVTDLRRARGVLDELRAMGVAIAIDDFGTGSSSLTQLQRLPVDEIKIDKSFVTHCDTSEEDQAIVRSTIELGHNLGIHVTAEGVETESVYRQLSELGCDYSQGFFLARPVSASRFSRELGTRTPSFMGGNEDRHVVPVSESLPALAARRKRVSGPRASSA